MRKNSCLEITIKALAKQKFSVILETSEGTFEENFTLNLKSIKGSASKKLDLNLQAQKELGDLLFKNLISGKIYDLYSEKRQSGFPLRIRLNIEPLELQSMPWELMYDVERDSWLSRDPDLTFSRFHSTTKCPKVSLQVPVSLLLAMANPLGLDEHELDLDKERDKIHSALQHLIDSREINLTLLNENVTLQEIQGKLQNNVNILHISGHGGFIKNELNILLEDDTGRQELIPFERFAAMISGMGSLKVVILDACELSSGAISLLKKKIPVVIAMRTSILDESATAFFSNFYESIVKGIPIDKAITIARMNLVATYGENRVDWFTPILYLSSSEFAIIGQSKRSPKSIPSPKSIVTSRSDNLSAFRDIGRFVGRRTKISELKEKLFNNDTNLVIVEGLSGDGKTALVSKVLMEEKEKFAGIYSHRVTNETSMELLLSEFNDFLEKNQNYLLNGIWNQPNTSIQQKIEKMIEVLVQNRFIIFLDGIQNLVTNNKIEDKNIEKFLELLVSRKLLSKVILTTWERFEIAQGAFLGSQDSVYLPALEPDEGRRLLSKLGMGKQPTFIKNKILRITGRSPKFIELFVGLTKKFTINDLLKDPSLFTRQAYGRIGKSFIERLDANEKAALQYCVLFTRPVSMSLLEKIGLQPEIISRLADLLVLEVDHDDNRYWVHDSLAYTYREYLSENSQDEYKKLQNKLGECFEENARENRSLWTLLEARYHFLEAKNYVKAMNIALVSTDPLITWGYLDLALRINNESVKTATSKNKGVFLRHISGILEHKGEYDKALETLDQSEKIFQELDDNFGLSSILYLRGVIYHDTGELDKALNCFYASLDIAKKIGEKGGILTNLQHIAIILQDRGEYELSSEKFNQCLTLATEIGEERSVAASLHHIGITYQHKGEYKKAIELFNESIQIEQKFGDIRSIAGNMHHIAIIYKYKGEYDEALKIFKQILKIFENVKDPRAVAATHHEIGTIYQSTGNNNKAIEMFNNALLINREIGDPLGVASSLYHIGIAYQLEGEYDKALKIYNETFKTFEIVGDQMSMSAVLHNMGLINESKGELDNALELFNQALKIKNKLGDRPGASITLFQMGVIHQLKAEYNDALRIFNETLITSTDLGDQAGISACFHEIGTIFQLNGNYKEALESYNSALKIREKIGDKKGVAATLMQIGQVYEHGGRIDEAMNEYQKGLRIFKKINDPIGVCGVLHSIGEILQSKGEFDQALKAFFESKEIAEKIGLQRGVSASLHHIGMILQDKGDSEGALNNFNQARILSEKILDQRVIGASIHHIGLVYLDNGEYDKAIEEFNKSLVITTKINDRHGMATTLQQMGIAHTNKGEFEEALKVYDQSLTLFDILKDQQGIAVTNYLAGQISYDMDHFDQASLYFEKSLPAFTKIGNLRCMTSIFLLLGEINAKKQSFKKAIIYCRMGLAISGLINSPGNELNKLYKKIQFTLGDQEFERINKEIDRNNSLANIQRPIFPQ